MIRLRHPRAAAASNRDRISCLKRSVEIIAYLSKQSRRLANDDCLVDLQILSIGLALLERTWSRRLLLKFCIVNSLDDVREVFILMCGGTALLVASSISSANSTSPILRSEAISGDRAVLTQSCSLVS
jgi:hypothetical protein